MSDPGLFRRAVVGARWIGVSKTISQCLTWAITIVVVRLLDPSDYGIMATSGLLTVLAALLLDAGLGIAFVQRKDTSIDVYRSANTALVISTFVAILVVQALALPAAVFFSEPQLEAVLRVSSLQFLPGALCVVPAAELTRQMRFGEIGIANAIAGVSAGLITLMLAYSGAGVWALVVGTMCSAVFRLACYCWRLGSFYGFSSRLAVLRSYLAFSSRLIAQRFVWFWVDQGDLLVVGRLLGAAPLGAYSVAKNLSQIPLDRTAEIVNQVALPAFSAVQNDHARWQDALRKLLRLTSVGAFPLFWGMAAVAPVALPLLLGDKWAAAVVPFALLCVVLPLRTATAFISTVLLALGNAGAAMRIMLIWAAVLMPLVVLGAKWGIVGVALAWALGFPIIYLLIVMMVSRAMGVPISTLVAPMMPSAIAGAACAAAALGTQWLLQAEVSQPVLLGLQILAGAAFYAAVLLLFARRTAFEFANLIASLLGLKWQRKQP